MTPPPKLGFFIQPVHPPDRDYADVLREDREAVVLADRLGFCEAFIGEHVADAAETITSSLAFIASLADRCPRIVFGTGVLPLPNYHPVMVAAQVAMIDHLVDGRLLLGIGPGVPPDAVVLDNAGPDRRQRLAEALQQILDIWSGEPPYRLAGEFYRTNTERVWAPAIGVGSIAKPRQRPHPPIVVTSIRPDSETPYTAGLRGWSGISATYVGDYVVRAHLEGYRAGRAAAGLSDTSGWRVARSVFVADDEKLARKYANRAEGAHGFYFHVMRTKLAQFGGLPLMGDSPQMESSRLSLAAAVDRLVISGTPEQVAEQIVSFRQRVGPFGTLLYTGHDWVDRDLARRSMELMANEVWPRVVEATR